MKLFQPRVHFHPVLFLLATLLPSNRLAAQHTEEVPPLSLSEFDELGLICDFESHGASGGESSASSSRWLQYDNPGAIFSPQRIGTTRIHRFQSENTPSPDANHDGHLSRDELDTLDEEHRTQLLRQYDTNADGQLTRYELPEKLPETETQQLQPEYPSPLPDSPTTKQSFQNLKRFGLPTTRQPTASSKPFARAATFGARIGSSRSNYGGASASSCRSSRSSAILIVSPVR